MTERRVRVPGDKSITHRALLFGALARGRNRIRNPLTGADPQATAAALRALGCAVPPLDGGEIVFEGVGAAGLRSPAGAIDCANSGTTARLLLGLLAGVPLRATLTGDASLRRRPMRRVTEPLAAMGARFHELDESDRLPITVEGGALRPYEHESAHASAQVKSALLLAGLTGNVAVTVTEPVLSRDHTERMLSAMGARLRTESLDDGRARVTLEDAGTLEPLDITVPGDFSSAAFFIALGLLGPTPVRVEGVGVNPTRSGLLPVLARMGARIDIANAHVEGGEEVADIVAWPSELHGATVVAAEIPAMIDEVPVLAVLAARARGETTITGAGELRVKESDRITALVSNLGALGASAEEFPDGLVVAGSDAPLQGTVRTHDDHRIAMAFGVLGAAPGASVEIDDPDVVAVSFPGFWELLRGEVMT